ncbi:hypothetical protein SAMN05421783_1024 [Thiocapsa roseopersicina]|uniref:Uncharacterized protein n=1 Tax=Thiocapsa roseopersicina TaxID=1058 RepID=A0A1H2RH10_THIRO|nr:hypothetical protein SAMN05421783_1024 [Thiocapsa roseopersicina]
MIPVVMPEDRSHAPKTDPLRSEIRAPETDCPAAPATAYVFDFEGVVRRSLETSTSIYAPRPSAAVPTAESTSVSALRSPRRSIRLRWWTRFLPFRRTG